jgi:hypothetical protein
MLPTHSSQTHSAAKLSKLLRVPKIMKSVEVTMIFATATTTSNIEQDITFRDSEQVVPFNLW